MINVAKLDAIKLSLVASAFAFASIGCAAQTDSSDEDVDTSADAIVGGQTTSSYAAVGALTQRGQAFCTGTLVAKRVVVTAAHCLQGLRASSVRFVLGSNASSPQASLAVSRVTAHPQYNAQRLTNDIGVLVLSQDAPVAPVAINSSMTASWVGRSLTFVGYGVTNGYTQAGAGVKRAVSIPVSEVGSTQFAYEDSRKNTCFGDSGGPAFAQDANGNLSIVGVTSYGDETCTQYGVDTRVDAFRSFITAAQQ